MKREFVNKYGEVITLSGVLRSSMVILGILLVVAIIVMPTTDDNTPESVDRAEQGCAKYGGIFAMGTRLGKFGPWGNERQVWVICNRHVTFEWTYTKDKP